MRAYFLLEWKVFSHNLKNRAVFLLFLIATVYYALVNVPQYVPIEAIDQEVIQDELSEGEYFLETTSEDTQSASKQAYLQLYPQLNEINQHRLNALEKDDYKTYLAETIQWFGISPIAREPKLEYYTYDQPYPDQEAAYFNRYTMGRYTAYLDGDYNLTLNVLEERRALQTLQRTLNGKMPFILIALVVLFSFDVLTVNKGHKTIVQSLPLTFRKQLIIKTVVLLAGIFLTLGTSFILWLFLIGGRYGIGSWNLPVPVYGYSIHSDIQIMIPMVQFLLQALALFFLITVIFSRGILIVSLLLKNEIVNLVVGLSCIFLENTYYMRGIGYFSSVSILPPTFFKIGAALSGYQNHLYTTDIITFGTGLLSLSILWLLIEFILYFLTTFKFFRTV